MFICHVEEFQDVCASPVSVRMSVCTNTCVCHRGSRASVSSSPHRPAGRRAAACLTAHCACPRHLPWLLDVGGGEGLQQGREDPSGISGRAGREKETQGNRMKNAAEQMVDTLDDLIIEIAAAASTRCLQKMFTENFNYQSQIDYARLEKRMLTCADRLMTY